MNVENKKQLATILLAVGLGLVAAFLTSQYVQKSIEEQTATYKKDFEKRTVGPLAGKIESLDKQLGQMAADQAELMKRYDLQTQKLREIEAGRSVFVPSGPSQPERTVAPTIFSTRTPPGKRAMTIKIDTLSAVGGFVNPGDFVDVIAELKIPDEKDPAAKPQEVTSTLFQNIEVLAVGTHFEPIQEAESYAQQHNTTTITVTLALDPKEAGLITFAQANGKLKLALRSPAERQERVVLEQVASWDALSDFILEEQGTKLHVPRSKAKISEVEDDKKEDDEFKPFIQIFRGGREL